LPTEIKIALKNVGCRVRMRERERERERARERSFIKRGCHVLRLYSVGDRCMGLDRSRNDTDRGTSKYEYRTRSQMPLYLPKYPREMTYEQSRASLVTKR